MFLFFVGQDGISICRCTVERLKEAQLLRSQVWRNHLHLGMLFHKEIIFFPLNVALRDLYWNNGKWSNISQCVYPNITVDFRKFWGYLCVCWGVTWKDYQPARQFIRITQQWITIVKKEQKRKAKCSCTFELCFIFCHPCMDSLICRNSNTRCEFAGMADWMKVPYSISGWK